MCFCEVFHKFWLPRHDVSLHPTFLATIFAMVGLDVIHMPTATEDSK